MANKFDNLMNNDDIKIPKINTKKKPKVKPEPPKTAQADKHPEITENIIKKAREASGQVVENTSKNKPKQGQGTKPKKPSTTSPDIKPIVRSLPKLGDLPLDYDPEGSKTTHTNRFRTADVETFQALREYYNKPGWVIFRFMIEVMKESGHFPKDLK